MSTQEHLPKVPELKNGEIVTQEQLDVLSAQGKLLCVGFESVQVAQVLALEMVRQGQLSQESLENIGGSHIFLRRTGEKDDAEVTIVFYGRMPFSADGFKPSN